MRFLLIFCLMVTSAWSKTITLTSENCVTLRGPVTGESVAELMQDLHEVSKRGSKDEPIYLVLNTPGGSVFAGLDLIEYMNSLKRPVHVVAVFAASMGFQILQNGNTRYITKTGTIMSHRASGGFSGDIPQQVNSRFKHVLDVLEKMDEQVISRTNGKWNKKTYMELIRDEYWAVGSNAIEDGFADEVASLTCASDLDGSKEKDVFTPFGVIKSKIPNCPLLYPQSLNPSENEKLNSFFNPNSKETTRI